MPPYINMTRRKQMWEPDKFMSQPEEGLILQTRTTYRVVNGKIHRETVTRRYYSSDDYQDSTSTEVLNIDL